MKVRDLMQTDIVTLRATDTLDIADAFMRLGLIRHLPVVDEENHLLGLVTQTDLLKASVSSVLGFNRTKEQEWLGTIAVRDVMVADVTAIGPDVGLAEAVDTLAAGKLGCLPVVETTRLVGILTETDCLRCLADLLKTAAFRNLLT